MNRLVTMLLAAAGVVLPMLAQEAGAAEIQGKMVQHWKTSKQYVLALAEQMPAADYTFKPNKDEMSFGQQMAHIAGANSYFFATLSGKKDPIAKPTQFDKENVMKLLNQSYDFVISTLEDLDFAQMHQSFDMEGQKMSGLEVYLLAIDHTAHHRGQAIVYLRAKNITPAEYKF